MSSLPYIVEVQICFAVLWLFYHVALKRSVNFSQNRFYLLSMAPLSFVIPLLSIPVWTVTREMVHYPVWEAGYAFPAMVPAAVASSFNPAGLLPWAYLAGVAVMAGMLLFNIRKIVGIYRKAKPISHTGAVVYQTTSVESSFTFFNSIFINIDGMTPLEAEHVLTHEMSHVRLHHSLDLVLGQVLLLFFWWNPFVWLWHRSLKEVHEFQADEAVLESGFDSENYISLLLKEIADIHPEFVSGFSYSLIKNRLIMITKRNKSRFAGFRILLSVPLLAALMALFSFTERVIVVEPPTDVITNNALPRTFYIDGVKSDESDFQKLNADNVESISILKGDAATIYGLDVSESIVMVTTTADRVSGENTTDSQQRSEPLAVALYGKIADFQIRADAQPIRVVEVPRNASEMLLALQTNLGTRQQEGSSRLQVRQNTDNPSIIDVHGSGNPVFYLDGVKSTRADFQKLDPNNIESISLLKDASAAIYGVDASNNGVVLVTTKAGQGERRTYRGTYTSFYDAAETVSAVRNTNIAPPEEMVVVKNSAVPTTSGTKYDGLRVVGYGSGQRDTMVIVPSVNGGTFYARVDQMPTFQGGDLGEFKNWVFSRLMYPAEAREKGISGTVIVIFVVEKDGSISIREVVSSPDKSLSNEVMRVMLSAPKWTPGTAKGTPIEVQHTLPITFQLAK